MKSSLVLSVLTLFVTATVAYESHECGRSYTYPEKVVGGNVSAEGQWPWAAALALGRHASCTGSIISPRHILTAGHCAGQGANFYRILLGSVNSDKSPVKASVCKVIVHPGFVENVTGGITYELKDDIAVIELNEPLNFTKTIRPICLPLKFTVYFGGHAYTAGWGHHDEKLPNGTSVLVGPDRFLRDATVTFHPYADCHIANLDDTNNVTDPIVHPKDVLCAGAKGQGPNHGDSGGPLMVNRGEVLYQVGIFSYLDDKEPFRQDKYPGKRRISATFTRVTSYCDWIEKATEGAAKRQSIP